MTDITEQEADSRFAGFLSEQGLSPCKCGRVIDRADVAWNSGETEAGTGYSVVEVQCISCLEEITHWSSWYSEIDNFEELVKHVLPDWHDQHQGRPGGTKDDRG